MSDLRLDPTRLEQLRQRAVVVQTAPTAFRVEGPGAVDCLQGLLTNDLVKPGDQSIVYGAMLTPKGMIIVDYWALRLADAVTLVARLGGHGASVDLFTRRLPPRLARVTDLTETTRAAWLIGPEAFQVLVRAGLRGVPETCGKVASVQTDAGPLLLALAPETAPFVAVAVGESEAVERFVAMVTGAGAVVGDAMDLDAARILAGWPALGAEIDDRTLPQEVRYDEIGGVSYTKGCYTGQETVARLHFRGHTNRELRGLVWRGKGPPEARAIVQQDGKEIGTVRSTLSIGPATLGLGLMRREVEPGDTVSVDGHPVRVTALPFGAADLDS